ncbi:MAG: manganese efflux pump MntP family protein [Candidatus Bathyarchaeales archaeon]
MDVITLFAVAISLALDAFSVSIASGMQTKSVALKMATSFGAFQAIMPLIGWSAGIELLALISGVDHWAAFTILSIIGLKMIYEALKQEKPQKKPLNLYTLLLLSIATSIDALAAGLSFAFLKISILTAITVIGTVTFALAFLGALFGNKLGNKFSNKVAIAGGLILIGIGTKIVIEHLA